MAFTSEMILGPRIDSGHFGDVHEGDDPIHGKVAVKVLRQSPNETAADWAARSQSLLQEAQQLKLASHENVVRVLNVVSESTNAVVHLVSEFCDGGSLQSNYEGGPLTLSVIRDVTTCVCRGLSNIHNCGMIHRDIKPGNLLNAHGIFKVGDFGLVTQGLILGYASAAGYLDHLAPEVYNDGITSVRTDIWALGMTVYRLLHGHRFYEEALGGKPIGDMIRAGGFSRRLEWLPHVPNEWRKFVRKAMHDDSGQRFQSAHEMGQALAKLAVTPSWKCAFNPTSVRWSTMDRDRKINVLWTKLSPRRYEWAAWRTGGAKRDMIIAGTGGTIITGSQAERDLVNFFAGSR